MRKSLAVLVAGSLAVALTAAPATAGKKKKKQPKPQPVVFEESGTIAGPNPLGQFLFGVTEGEFTQVHTCGQLPASQGLDGYIVELPEAFFLGGLLEVTGSSPAPYDLAVYYYDAGCSLMNEYSLNNGADESGAIAPGAKWVVIDLLVGANTGFVLKATTTA